MDAKLFNKEIMMNIPDGWWLQISPLARLDPENWILGVLRRGKKAWITEQCKSGFTTSQEAYDWGIQWINEYKQNEITK